PSIPLHNFNSDHINYDDEIFERINDFSVDLIDVLNRIYYFILKFNKGYLFDEIYVITSEKTNFWTRDPDSIIIEVEEVLRLYIDKYAFDLNQVGDNVVERLIQTPADFRFSSHDNQPIDAVPFKDAASNREFAETTLSDAVEKAQELRERLEQANANPSVKRSVDRLLAVLPTHLDALNPALMRSKTRSLEASALAYASAGAEAELFPDAVAELLALVGTLKDLQGCFPQIADVERNTVRLKSLVVRKMFSWLCLPLRFRRVN
ncbi:hypothetical protein, partial [Agrobacterium vitis]|uniref:hypothetical protein n=1 Tax=Agrobacterium vitis TaxID=373 RepID=UPI0018D25EBC